MFRRRSEEELWNLQRELIAAEEEDEYEEYDEDLLGEANCYDEIYLQQNRIGCATIPWTGLKKAIEQYKSKN